MTDTGLTIGQSLLGTSDKCLRSLQYDIQGAPAGFAGKTSAVRALGTAYHYAHEIFYRWFIEPRETGAPPALDVLLEKAAANLEWALAGNDEYRGKVRTGLEVVWAKALPDSAACLETLGVMLASYYHGTGLYYPVKHIEDAGPGDWRVLGVEQPFKIETRPGLENRGEIDLALVEPGGHILVEDHKTCGKMWDQYKYAPRKQNQSPLYMVAARHLWPGAPGYRFAFGIMTYKGVFDRRVTTPNEAHMRAILDKSLSVKQVVEPALAAGLSLPANPASTLCSPKFCDHWLYCPFGAALDQ